VTTTPDQPIKPGDKLQMPGVPFIVEVLELKPCDEDACSFGDGTLFRFADPSGQGDDWAHVSEFERLSS
jgi:hypothetical protein